MPLRRLRCLLAPLVAWTAVAWVVSAVGAQTAELTSIREVVALDGMAAGKNPRPVKLQGVVTEVGPASESVTLDDGQQGVGVMLGPGVACPAIGDRIEVEGVTMTFMVYSFSHARVRASRLEVQGRGTLPTPLELSLGESTRCGISSAGSGSRRMWCAGNSAFDQRTRGRLGRCGRLDNRRHPHARTPRTRLAAHEREAAPHRHQRRHEYARCLRRVHRAVARAGGD